MNAAFGVSVVIPYRDAAATLRAAAESALSQPEAAEVLNMAQRRILSAVYGGELKATMAGHDIVSISRSELVAWLRRQEL